MHSINGAATKKKQEKPKKNWKMFAQLKKTRYLCGVNQLKQPQKTNVMDYKYFSKEAFMKAVRDIQSKGETVHGLDEVERELDHSYYYNSNVRKVLNGMNIENYCEVVPTFFIYYKNDGDYIEGSFRGYSLHIIGTDDYYFICRVSGSDKVYLRSWWDMESPNLNYFHTELIEPNKIGTPTRAKIEAWRNYCNAITTEKQNYINISTAKVRRQMERAANCGLQTEVRRDGNGEIIKVTIHDGGAIIKVTKGEGGANYSFDYDVIYLGRKIKTILGE